MKEVTIHGNSYDYPNKQFAILIVLIVAHEKAILKKQSVCLTCEKISQSVGQESECINAFSEYSRNEDGELDLNAGRVYIRAFTDLSSPKWGSPVEVITTQGEVCFRLTDTSLTKARMMQYGRVAR